MDITQGFFIFEDNAWSGLTGWNKRDWVHYPRRLSLPSVPMSDEGKSHVQHSCCPTGAVSYKRDRSHAEDECVSQPEHVLSLSVLNVPLCTAHYLTQTHIHWVSSPTKKSPFTTDAKMPYSTPDSLNCHSPPSSNNFFSPFPSSLNSLINVRRILGTFPDLLCLQ